MKKNELICLVAFSALSIVGFILSLSLALLLTKSMITSDTSTISKNYLWLNIVSSIINGISLIGSLVSGIIVLIKSKNYSNASGIAKASSITAIAGGSIGIFMAFISLLLPTGFSVGSSIVVIVAFGLSCATLCKLNKLH